MRKAPVDTVQIEVSRRLFRAMHYRPLNLLVCGLTGVSVSFCPYFLYRFGEERVPFLDWRVFTCFAVTYLVPLVYMRVGAPGPRTGMETLEEPRGRSQRRERRSPGVNRELLNKELDRTAHGCRSARLVSGAAGECRR